MIDMMKNDDILSGYNQITEPDHPLHLFASDDLHMFLEYILPKNPHEGIQLNDTTETTKWIGWFDSVMFEPKRDSVHDFSHWFAWKIMYYRPLR